MSPSEADLRAALREGEGDGVDPYDIIWNVRQARARRRTMMLSAAAAVVVVGGSAAGITALVNSAGSPNGVGGANAQANNNNVAGGAAGGSSSNAAHVPAAVRPTHGGMGIMGGAASTTCATRPSSGSSSHHAQASGSLLPGPVKQFVVCAYTNAGVVPSAGPQPVVVRAPAARQLAHSLRNLPATPHLRDCPMIASTPGTALRIVPVTPTGQHLPTITANIGRPACETVVTNGSAVRYNWQLPPHVAALLHLPPGPIGGLTPMPNGKSGTPPK